MHEVAGRHPGSLVSLGGSGERDFEARLADCATLAVRVAYGVLRNRADAEEVAQEAPPVRRRRSNSFRKRFVGAWSRSHRSWR
jgi:hypothetical protein